jgi:glutamate--cysteine ligase
MSGVVSQAGEPIADKRPLVAYLESGCKPPERWRIGTEHEKFAYRLADLSPLSYDGADGIRALLEGLTRFGWQPVAENGNVIALAKPDGSAVTLEPAGQVELAGAPLETIHQTCDEVNGHLMQVKTVARQLGIGFIGLGYRPLGAVADIPWMPKRRYAIMRAYMPKKGGLGLDMMLNTCTVQVNLDFDSEATMVRMFRIGLALQPIATALFANSPFKEGRPNGFLTYRSHVWTDTDADRCGTLPFVFEDGFGFERYADYALDVPMYFVYRDGRYIDVAGQSFRDFLAGRLPGLPGERPHIGDWQNHLTTVFTEVRMKTFLEMRGADGGPWARLCALPALWVGLLYDRQARDEAWALVEDWTAEERERLRAEVPKCALKTRFRNRTVREIARDALEIAHGGLCRRARLGSDGLDEAHFLRPLFRIAESGLTPAEELLAAYDRRWRGSVEPVYREYSY